MNKELAETLLNALSKDQLLRYLIESARDDFYRIFLDYRISSDEQIEAYFENKLNEMLTTSTFHVDMGNVIEYNKNSLNNFLEKHGKQPITKTSEEITDILSSLLGGDSSMEMKLNTASKLLTEYFNYYKNELYLQCFIKDNRTIEKIKGCYIFDISDISKNFKFLVMNDGVFTSTNSYSNYENLLFLTYKKENDSVITALCIDLNDNKAADFCDVKSFFHDYDSLIFSINNKKYLCEINIETGEISKPILIENSSKKDEELFNMYIEKKLKEDVNLFKDLKTPLFDKKNKKTLKSCINIVKQSLKDRVSEKVTEEDRLYANEIMTMVTEKIAQEKQNLKQAKKDKKEKDKFNKDIDRLGKSL